MLMVNDGLKIVLNIDDDCLKRMEARILSSAVVEVKIGHFVLKIRSLCGVMCEFDRTEDSI